MTVDPQMLQRAAEVIQAAEGLVLMAGAGMGAEAGRAELQSDEDLWRAYPPLGKLGLSLAELVTPQWFEGNPALAWGVYGWRLEQCRRTSPHAGFAILRRWMAEKPQGGFVFTSCVDGCFQRGGLAEERIVECHGSLEHLQCVKPCCAATWPVPAELPLAIDPETLRASGDLPRCVRCGGLARPNVLMTGDGAWSSGRTLAQQVRFRAWLGSLARGKFSVIEVGAKLGGETVREAAEQLAGAGRVPLVRIGPDGTADSPNAISLAGEAPAVLEALAAAMA
jgi:NAD-dependent SIR2 family protein deacetylase